MYISYNWLQDFVKIPNKVSAKDMADKLTAHTVEVEGYFDQKEKFRNVVVGRVLEVNKHPNADKLRLALVDIKEKQLRIVCGASNLEVGQLVPVATVGAVLPGDFEIKLSNIRGEESEGMICAEDELGLGDDHEGIMVLDKRAKIGSSFAEYLNLKDIVFEVDNKSLSNRPDLLNHYGLARELSTIFELRLKPYDKIVGPKQDYEASKGNNLAVEVVDSNLCPRYMAVRIENITITDSPAWLKDRLIAVNQRPINNIVDLTNYVMLECGQPLHVFDAGKVKKIQVRQAAKGETIETLDDKERVLAPEDLVITDGKNPIAIAGVMGGKNSEVDENSVAIILEAANFRADSVRKTSQRLGLRTEASLRFEKSLDPELTSDAIYRFISLLKEACPQAKVVGPVIDLYSKKQESEKIILDFAWLFAKIGQEIPRDQIVNILSHLGFKLVKHKDNLEVQIPSWRATKDVKSKEDIAEEVLRIYGYNNIESTFPIERMGAPVINQERVLERKIKDILALKFSLTESYNYSFVGSEQLKKLNIDFFNHLRLVNPLSEVHSMLRQSLVAGLTGNIKSNQAKEDELRFFEVGSVFFDAPGDFIKNDNSEDKLPYQEKKIGIALANNKKDVFSQLKSVVTSFLQELLGKKTEITFSHFDNLPGWADSKMCAQISVHKQEIGLIGLLSREAAVNTNIKLKTALAEVSLKTIIELLASQPDNRFQEPPKFPPIIRDLSFVVSGKILYNDIKKEIASFHELIKSEELIDVYVGDKLTKGEKSLAFRIHFQADDRTLVSSEIDELQVKLINHLAEKFEARIRDF